MLPTRNRITPSSIIHQWTNVTFHPKSRPRAFRLVFTAISCTTNPGKAQLHMQIPPRKWNSGILFGAARLHDSRHLPGARILAAPHKSTTRYRQRAWSLLINCQRNIIPPASTRITNQGETRSRERYTRAQVCVCAFRVTRWKCNLPR